MKRKKILILSLLAFLLPQIAQAALTVDWLLGLSGGYILQRARLTSTLNYTQAALTPGAFQTHFKNNLHDNSYLIGILGGVQFNCQDWLLGLELAVDGYDLDDTERFVKADLFGVRGWQGQASYDKGTALGVSLRWGYKVTKTIWPYLRVGAEVSKDELTVSFAGSPFYPGQFTTQDDSTMLRYLIGFGAEALFPKVEALKLRLEYNYLSKGQSLDSSGLIIDGLTNPHFFSEVTQARYHLWKLAVVWYFG